MAAIPYRFWDCGGSYGRRFGDRTLGPSCACRFSVSYGNPFNSGHAVPAFDPLGPPVHPHFSHPEHPKRPEACPFFKNPVYPDPPPSRHRFPPQYRRDVGVIHHPPLGNDASTCVFLSFDPPSHFFGRLCIHRLPLAVGTFP